MHTLEDKKMKLVSLILLFLAFLLGTSAEQCGTQAGGEVCPNGYVVANLDGVATQMITVEMVAKASFLLVVPLQLHLLLLLVVAVAAVAMLAASSTRLFLTKCLNIGTISLLLPNLSMALAQLVMSLHVKGSLRLS